MKIRKRIITLGLVLGLAVNQIILYESKVIADDSVDTNVIPEFLLNDIKKETSNRNVNPVPSDSSSYQPIVQQRAHNTSVQYNNNITIEQQYPKRLPQQNSYTPYQNGTTGYDPNRPEWQDFCPSGWENVTLDPKEGTYWVAGKANRASARRYWYDRRISFEKDVSTCDTVQVELRNACYQKITYRQLNLNKQREHELQLQREEQILRQQQAAMAAQQFSAQLGMAMEAQRDRELRQQEMLFKYMARPTSNNPTTYRLYNQYGQPQGYIQQSYW